MIFTKIHQISIRSHAHSPYLFDSLTKSGKETQKFKVVREVESIKLTYLSSFCKIFTKEAKFRRN
ncbi:hypothetical protein C1S86_03695 [Vibrio parahaemolyticus]|nr:hypothetical protein [Vibrio parahaemolyticus]EGR0299234.1 hypothetical protein [Vibrio parahaemolyticus]EGR1557982.1 hypothetical protein [Vibrio parahaemolyticus]EGR2697722.1 hypothetical protein [Vibrio parahaemolyticus]KAB5601517.1 hypothetical protein F0578_01875 [Vibrio parahaemolyticus]